MKFRSGGTPVSVEDLERQEVEQHLGEVRTARVAAARANPLWTEIEAADLVARPPGYLVSVDTDAYFTPARGTIWEPATANVFATSVELFFYVDDSGGVNFLERRPGSWSDVVARRASAGRPRLAPRRH